MMTSETAKSQATCLGSCLSIFFLCIFPFIFLALAITLGISILVEDSWFAPGDDDRFDPVSAYEAVHDHAGENTELASIEAWYVRSDGTLDLNADYNPRVVYEFYRKLDETPDDAPPVGAGGSLTDEWYEVVQVNVYDPWSSWTVRTNNTRYQYINLGMEREHQEPQNYSPGEAVPAPQCSFKDLWKKAIERGAPEDAVATISYDTSGYRFVINGAPIFLRFGMDCKLK